MIVGSYRDYGTTASTTGAALPLVDGVAMLPASAVGGGSHSLVASYLGSGAFAASESGPVGHATGDVGGTVPATLSLVLGAPVSFGAFTPGVAGEYTATTTARVLDDAHVHALHDDTP
ncbi:MAG TPA: hypothetical protein VNS09_02940 [Solirubrobacter sp.]|nr:hypothetical protein [Solirubrobacter sp.]